MRGRGRQAEAAPLIRRALGAAEAGQASGAVEAFLSEAVTVGLLPAAGEGSGRAHICPE
jgi:hypothetical protein